MSKRLITSLVALACLVPGYVAIGAEPTNGADTDKLRRQIAEKKPSAEVVAKALVEKGYLTKFQATKLVADATQEAFVRVYRNRMKFDSRQKCSTWLYAIAGNLVRDRYRGVRRESVQ
mgnify:CR=1 FL=1